MAIDRMLGESNHRCICASCPTLTAHSLDHAVEEFDFPDPGLALLPDLVWAGREPAVRLIDLQGAPRRTIFTSARRASAQQPAIVACRAALLAVAEAGMAPPA